jgi:transposase-like protein
MILYNAKNSCTTLDTHNKSIRRFFHDVRGCNKQELYVLRKEESWAYRKL